ncbi:hypothetical protein PR048_018574 [Dryococelus australis]|uniref:Uncharacterized protein n=1 Tax=Dryococelus australis TaxID=614101 RepID=A0ABQ9HCR8_9NEOP|nr:hypothetical protein PR048_018574 [Dryococelus australis]
MARAINFSEVLQKRSDQSDFFFFSVLQRKHIVSFGVNNFAVQDKSEVLDPKYVIFSPERYAHQRGVWEASFHLIAVNISLSPYCSRIPENAKETCQDPAFWDSFDVWQSQRIFQSSLRREQGLFICCCLAILPHPANANPRPVRRKFVFERARRRVRAITLVDLVGAVGGAEGEEPVQEISPTRVHQEAFRNNCPLLLFLRSTAFIASALHERTAAVAPETSEIAQRGNHGRRSAARELCGCVRERERERERESRRCVLPGKDFARRLIAPTRRACSVSGVTLCYANLTSNSGTLLHAMEAHRLYYARMVVLFSFRLKKLTFICGDTLIRANKKPGVHPNRKGAAAFLELFSVCELGKHGSDDKGETATCCLMSRDAYVQGDELACGVSVVLSVRMGLRAVTSLFYWRQVLLRSSVQGKITPARAAVSNGCFIATSRWKAELAKEKAEWDIRWDFNALVRNVQPRRRVWSSAGMKEKKKGGDGRSPIPEQTRRPAESSSTIPTCENLELHSRGLNPARLGGRREVQQLRHYHGPNVPNIICKTYSVSRMVNLLFGWVVCLPMWAVELGVCGLFGFTFAFFSFASKLDVLAFTGREIWFLRTFARETLEDESLDMEPILAYLLVLVRYDSMFTYSENVSLPWYPGSVMSELVGDRENVTCIFNVRRLGTKNKRNFKYSAQDSISVPLNSQFVRAPILSTLQVLMPGNRTPEISDKPAGALSPPCLLDGEVPANGSRRQLLPSYRDVNMCGCATYHFLSDETICVIAWPVLHYTGRISGVIALSDSDHVLVTGVNMESAATGVLSSGVKWIGVMNDSKPRGILTGCIVLTVKYGGEIGKWTGRSRALNYIPSNSYRMKWNCDCVPHAKSDITYYTFYSTAQRMVNHCPRDVPTPS